MIDPMTAKELIDAKLDEAQKLNVTVPVVNLNGTSSRELVQQLSDAYLAVREAIKKVQMASPHGRDYQTVGQDLFRKAQREHSDRLQKLGEIASEMERIAIETQKQGR